MPKDQIPILDLSGLTPFQHYHGNKFDLVMQGGRVVALFESNRQFYELSNRFNNNEPVNTLDFIHCQREIRAMMMNLKNIEKRKEDYKNGKGPLGCNR